MKNLDISCFKMVVVEVIHIKGRGTAVTGRVEKGSISIGDIVCLMDSSENIISEDIIIKDLDIGFSRTKWTTVDEGMNVALMLGDIDIVIKSGYVLKGFE